MSAHLLTIAVGPVQEFIAAARRTRDLWFGSHLLSEISKATARAVADAGAKLIFPADGSDLSQGSDLNVANIILAELPDAVDAKAVSDKARDAANRRWLEGFADQVFHDFQAVIRRDIWTAQAEDVVEFYAAWVPFTEATYPEQRRRLARLMAGRKNCRNFRPADGRDGVPKSSLDGLRETVLTEDRSVWPARVRRKLRVRDGEQLDVVGLVKRTAEGHQPYPSVSRIAADPWLRGVAVKQGGRDALAALASECEALAADDLLHRIDLERLHPDYAVFPFEGTALFRTRHHELWEETREPRERFAQLEVALGEVERFAEDAGLGKQPDPYLAVLVADGDRMGEAISKLAAPEAHCAFSRELLKFANEAGRIVHEHHGVLVYSGGDDVLAFVPVDCSLDCAYELHEAFRGTMDVALQGIEVSRPTLSVGVAIGHFLENLEDLLAYGRTAEKAAKAPNRDELAIHLYKRGGGPVTVRRQWGDGLHGRVRQYADWFLVGVISNRTPYELSRLADVYRDWPEPTQAHDAMQRDAVPVIDRKRPSGITSKMTQIRSSVQTQVQTPEDLRHLADELLIARQTAVALRQSGRQAPAAAAPEEVTT